jgi:hypothetical protein
MATALRTDHVAPASDRCVVNNLEHFLFCVIAQAEASELPLPPPNKSSAHSDIYFP